MDFFLNQLLAATAATSPFRVEIPAQDLGPRDFVRVVAHYRDGVTVEAARLAVGGGAEEEVTVNMVELLTTVTPRPGAAGQQLEKEDFVIRHQGRALAVRHFARWDDLPLTLGLVIDTSDSMDSLIEDAREAGERFLKRAVRPHDRAFMVDFNTLPRLAQRITEDSTPLQHHLESLRARGETALYDAIVFSLLQFDGTSGRRALVVFTDGEDSASRYQPRQCVQQARLNGVPIFLITLGPPPDPSRQPHLLRNQMIARRSGGAVYYVTDPDDLDRIFAQVGTELRRQYLLTFTATRSLSPQELQEIEVEVMRKGMTVRTLLASQQRGG